MPPKAKTTKEMIIKAAFDLTREKGIDSLNVRAVANRLGCSTQPVMYWFGSVEELKNEVYAAANDMHSAYLLRGIPGKDPLSSIGLNYIRFAVEETNLFKLLFQSGYPSEKDLKEVLDSEDLAPIIEPFQKESGFSKDDAREVFLTVALLVHGYASIIANNSLEYDEDAVAQHLEMAFEGAVAALKGDKSK